MITKHQPNIGVMYRQSTKADVSSTKPFPNFATGFHFIRATFVTGRDYGAFPSI